MWNYPSVIRSLQLLGLAIHQPYNKSEHANPFATPLEILPEWYLLTTFNLLRILSSKFIGILCYSLYLLVKILIDIKTLSEDQEWYLFL